MAPCADRAPASSRRRCRPDAHGRSRSGSRPRQQQPHAAARPRSGRRGSPAASRRAGRWRDPGTRRRRPRTHRPRTRRASCAVRKMRSCQASPASGRSRSAASARAARTAAAPPSARAAASAAASSWTATRYRSGAKSIQPRARDPGPLVEDGPLGALERRPLLGGHARRDVHARHLDQQRQVAERRPEPGRLGRRSASGSTRLAAGSGPDPAAARRAPAGRRPRRRSGRTRRTAPGSCRPSGSNSMARCGLWRRNRKRSSSGGRSVRDLVRRGAGAPGGAHLAAADVEELVGHVERRLALEHLAADGIAAVARPAGRREVLAAALDGHARAGSTWRPSRRCTELGAAAERRDPALVAAARGPRRRVGPAGVADRLAVPVGGDAWCRPCRSSRR